MYKNKDTIFALSTPTGKSAIALIRISGKESINIIKDISSNMPKKEKQTSVNKIFSNSGEIIDKTLTTLFNEPRSYTGENMVEISIHGSGAIIKKLLKTLNNIKGCRMAEPGEFTRRAFENNKLDLTQVEAIADLINAETESQRKQAIRILDGGLTIKTNKISKKITKILADVEAVIDFSDEDLPDNLIINSKEQIKNIINEISVFIEDNKFGEKIRSGFIVAIAGKPNSGKSSFINKIAQREIAIVTKEPGTTRDIIELFVDFKGVPVKFYDTAGIRESKNAAESIGVKKAYEIMNISDINLIFIDNLNEVNNYDKINHKLFVHSKIDIRKKIEKNKNIFNISSKTGIGVKILLNHIYKKIIKNKNIEDLNVSRERQRNIFKNTLVHLKNSLKYKKIDLFAEDIRLSLKETSKITGNIDIEDILDIIFNDFCIGK